MTTATEQAIQRYILDEILAAPPANEDPLAGRELDSLAIEQLLNFIEEEFDVEFEDEELSLENFSSIPVLAGIVDAKRAALGPEAEALDAAG
jgi:acyl carrier protein